MKMCTRRVISLVAALTLLVTCLITGLVLPVAAEGENLFVNGDFESGVTADWSNDSTYILAGVGKDGGYGYYQNRTETDAWSPTGQVRYGTALVGKLEVNTEYVLSFDYKTSGDAFGQLYFDKPFGKTASNEALNEGWELSSGVTTWTTQSIRFKTPDTLDPNPRWEFSIRARGGAGEVWYDNFVLTKAGDEEEVPEATPSTKGSVFIEDFQNGNGGFKYGSAAAAVETEADGNAATVMDAKGTMLTKTVTTTMKVGQQYLYRFKYRNVAGVKARVLLAFYNKVGGGYQSQWFGISASETEWTYVQYSFIGSVEAESVQLGMYLEKSTNTADGAKILIDDVELIAVNNETNLLPGGDMNTKSAWFNSYHSKGGSLVADTIETDNRVMNLPVGKTDVWLNAHGMLQDKLYEVSFRYRGGKIVHYWSPTQAALYQNVGSVAASDTWVDFKAFVWTKGSKNGEYFMVRTDAGNGNAELYIDDYCVREVALTADATATVEAGKTTTLNVKNVVDGAVVPALTWTSDNEAVATVVDGVVTGVAEGTANITATAGPLSVTVAVTVTAAKIVDLSIIWEEDYEDAEKVNSIKNWTALGSVVADPKDGTNNVLKLTAAASTTYNGASMGMEKNKVYALSMDYMGGSVKLAFNSTRGIITPASTTYDAVNEWATLTYYIVTTDELKDDGFMMHLTAPVGTCFDNIRLKELGAKGDIAAVESGLLPGGDFEVANPVPWKTIIAAGATIVADPAGADNRVLYFPANYGAGAFWNQMSQGLQPNKTYILSADFYGDAIWVYLNPGKGIAMGKEWTKLAADGNAWKNVSLEFTTGASVENGAWVLGFGTNNNATTGVYMDNVKITEKVVQAATAITLEDTDVPVGGEKQLSATVVPEGASAGALTWTSSDPSIIAVDASGKVKAVASKGSVTITVTNGTLTDTAIVTISGDAATAVSLSKAETYVGPGETAQLVAVTTPNPSVHDAFVWSSSDTTVATVDQNGLVTATNKLGTTVITVTAGTLSASCTVIVAQEADSFAFADESVKLGFSAKGQKVVKTLTLVTTPAGLPVGEVVYASSNTAVATVDSKGQVTAVAEGTAVISVSKGGTVVDTCEVVVAWDGERLSGGDFENGDWDHYHWTKGLIKDGKASVVIDPANANNHVMALPNDGNGLSALWLSGLTINPGKTYKLTFKVKGDGTTEAQQLATYFHGASTNMNGWKYVSNLTGEWKEITYVFTTNVLDDNTQAALNRNYVFGFDNNKQGIIYMDDVSLVELPEATAIVLDESVELWPTGSVVLSVRTEPAEASAGALTWASSDASIVSVDQNGKVTAVAGSGSATITVTTEKGLSDSVVVTVNEYANLLENGDFEQGDLNWPSHATIQAGVGKDGSYGMVLDNTDGKRDHFFKSTLAMYPGATYIVEWDYLATTDAEFRLWGGKINVALSAKAGDGTEWKHGSTVFTTPTNMADINSAANKGWIFSITSDKSGTPFAVVDNVTIKLYNSGVKAESIKLTKNEMTLLPGRTANLGIMATPTDGDINMSVWTSSDENVATVEYGIVTAVGKGTATITATTRDGVSASCVVTVSGNPAFITNGTFEDSNDKTWGVADGAAIVDGLGVQSSNAAQLPTNGVLTYNVKGLKANTTYQFFLRHRSTNAGKLSVALMSGSTNLLDGQEIAATDSWTKTTYEFTTGDAVDETCVLTLKATSGIVLLDHIFLTEKATLIDFVVENMFWTEGDQVKPGTEMFFAVTFRNVGEDPVKAGSTISIDICMDSKKIQTIEYTFTSEFAGGELSEIVMSKEPWKAIKGDHVISARVNSTLSVLESNTDNNNMVQTDLRVYDELLEIPELAAQAGFDNLSFSDEFNSLDTVDVNATGADGFKWYVTRPYGATTLTPDDYSIENGILTMKNVIPTYNMGFSSADVKTGRGYTWNKGYLEYKIRIPRPRENADGEKGVPAVWSLPLDKLMAEPGCQWVEMDWMEYWGITKSRPGGYYTITMHDQGTDEKDNQIWYNKNSNSYKEGLGDGEWHIMSFLWVQDLLLGYLDGEQVFRITYSEDSFSDPMPSIGMADERGGVGAFSYMNVQKLVLHLGGSQDNPMEVDYVRIWTGVDNGEFVPPANDDDEGTGEEDFIIDVEADSFWSDYCTDDFGDPIVTIDEYNYEYVLMGAEFWPYLSDERKAEINALLAANGQPTFEELIEMAQAFADGEADQPEADDSPETGETATLPVVLATTMLLGAAGLWVSRKRKTAK